MRKFLLLGLMLLLTSVVAFGQERIISGTVVSDDDGFPVPGATILLKGSTRGTVTDADGRFSIRVNANSDVLEFSFVGYKKQEVTVGNQSIIDVILLSEITGLNEVIVTGYLPQTKREITGSISSVRGEVIENLPLQSFDRALQGRAAGVLVQNASGIPGSGVRVRIRGQGSINAGNNPLYIVDGVQFNDENRASNVSTNPLASINPNDIESIEVLKDAAASIYGAQAANGVVIITTKRGKAGKTKINFNTYIGSVEPIRQLDMMNSQEFINYRLQANRNFYSRFAATNPANTLEGLARRNALAGITSASWAPLGLTNPALGELPIEDFNEFVNGIPTYDWLGEILSQSGRIRNYELSASGGDEKTRFFISAAYNKQEGQVRQFDFERANIRFNIDHKFNDKLSFSTQTNLSTTAQNATVTGGTQFENPMFAGLGILPFAPIFREDGEFNEPLPGILQENPLKSLSMNERFNRTNQLNGNFNITYKIRRNLTFTSFYGLDYRAIEETRYTDPRSFGGRNVQGSAFAQYQNNINWITTQKLNYNLKIDDNHRIDVLLGVEYREESREGFSASAQGFPTPSFRTIQSAAEPTGAGGFFTIWKNAGAFTNLKYNFRNKLTVNGTLRYDGSSRFGVDNRWGLFPSIGAAYVLSEEGFLKDSRILEDLKVRASIGTAGNNRIDNFASRALISSAGASNYLNIPGLTVSGLGNNFLSWETQTTINFGVDYAVLQGRITGSVDVYRRRSTDMLLSRNLPNTSGYGSINENVGSLDNRGIEIAIDGAVINTGTFRWNTNFNIAFQDQELLSLFEGQTNDGASRQVGQPLNLWVAARWAGVNPATGRPMYYDRNGEITYQPTSGSTLGDDMDDRVILGNSNSDFFGGWLNTFTYKNWTFDFMFQYDYGKLGTDGTGSFSYNPYEMRLNLYNRLNDITWSNPGDIVSMPRPNTQAELGAIGVGTGRTLQDLSYIRLKQVSLAYMVPQQYLQRIGVSTMKFYAQGINLWTLDRFTGLDVEFTGGTSTGIFPPAKNYTIGVQFGF